MINIINRIKFLVEVLPTDSDHYAGGQTHAPVHVSVQKRTKICQGVFTLIQHPSFVSILR